MSYAKNLQDKIRQEGYNDLPRRVAVLTEQLERPAALNRSNAARELRYLERAVLSGRGQFPELAEQIRALRMRFEMLPPPSSAPETEPVPARHDTSSAQSGSSSGVKAVASFLCPDEEESDGQDLVRLMSFEGRLPGELSRYAMISVPETNSALVLRSWTEEDDSELAEQASAKQRMALLELTQCAANLREMQEFVADHVAQQGQAIDEIQMNVSRTREDTDKAVTFLNHSVEANDRTNRAIAWIAPSLGVVLIGAACVTVPQVGIPMAMKGAILGTGGGILTVGAAAGGAQTLSACQQRTLARMQEQLPSTIQAIPKAQVAALCAKADEAEQCLLTKLGDTASWQKFPFSLKGLMTGLRVRQRSSETRPGGQAFATTFNTDVPAQKVFQTVQRLSMAGELDNGVKIVWSRPVDASQGVYMRYLAFSELSVINRDFFCVCRQGRVTTAEADSEFEHYVYVLASVDFEVLTMAGSTLPRPDTSHDEGSAQHGTIHICGFSIKDKKGGGAVVDVMGDVDQASRLPTVLADRDVRLHALRAAERVMSELRSEKHSLGSQQPAR